MNRQPASPNAREAQYWNSAATRPWAERHDMVDRLFADFTRAALAHAAVQPGERVLDIGCGSGTTPLALAAASLPQAEAALTDVSTHPFPPASFDLAFSRLGVMFFADPVAAFANVRNALKRGGRLTLAVFRTGPENGWSTAPAAAIRHLVPPVTQSDPEAPGMFSWADPARVRRILEGAGFREVSLTPHDQGMRLAGPGGADEAVDFAMTFGPVARAVESSALKDPDEARAGLSAFFAAHDGPQGTVLPGALWFVSARA